MKKVVKLRDPEIWESRLRGNLSLADEIRSDALSDLEGLNADFKHMSLVVDSLERNYKALLGQNRQLKDTLLKVVDQCYCWEGNRCQSCTQILQVLSQSQTHPSRE